MKKRLLGTALFLAAALVSGGGAAADKVVLKWGDSQAATHPSVAMWERINAEVSAKTQGRVVIQMFPGSQLGSSRDMDEATMTGTQEMVTEGVATFQAWVPRVGILESPYVYRDAEHMQKVMASAVGAELKQAMIEKANLRVLGTTYYGTRQLTTNRKVEKLKDMAGLRLRVPETDVFRAFAEAWGAKPTPMSFGELYLALQQNVVEAQENPLPTIDSGKFQEVQKFLVLTSHVITPRWVLINEKTFQKLSKEDQAALEQAVANGIAWQDAEIKRMEASILDKFKAAGMTIITPDVEEFRKPVLEAVPKKFESVWGAGTWEKIQAIK
jgi:tripartite ATP-independent transporter DctP family solute receptor